MVLQGVCIIFSLVLLKTLTVSTLYNRLIGYEAFLKSTHSHVFSKNRKHFPIYSSENCQFLQPLNNCNMSRVMIKLAFSICENKDADQLRVFVFAYAVTAKLISAFGFAIRRVQSLYFLTILCGPGQIPRRPFFSQRGSYCIGMFTLYFRRKTAYCI